MARSDMSASPSPASPPRRLTPLVLIGGLLLVLIVVFLIVSRGIMDDRADRPGTGQRQPPSASGSTGQGGVPSGIVFREDGTLRFTAGDGREKSTITIEIADTDERRTQGLMGRTSMREDQGMLFIFDREEPRSFWMANTPLPLDLLFVDAAGRIVTIHRNARPYSEESLPSTSPAQYVVEVNGGYTDRYGILEGDRIVWARR